MFNKKNIVLSGVNDNTKRAVLTIECDGKFAKGRIRLYNFSSEPKGILSLGLYNEGEVVKAGLIKSSNMLYTFACQVSKDFDNFSCAVINFYNGDPSPLLYGNSDGYAEQSEVFSKVIGDLSVAQSVKDVEETLDKYNIDFDDEYKEEVENEIDKCFENEECSKCEECVYRKFFLENNNNLTTLSEPGGYEEEKIVNDDINKKFYLDIKPQIDKLFEDNPSEDYLEELIPHSKWVKVSLDENGNYYVLGLLYEEDNLKYICYGVPGVYQKNAPRELSGYPIWFPLEQDKPEGFGYWLSYQDAENGESVKAIIV